MTIWDLNITLDHIKKYFRFLFEGEIKILDSDFPDHFDNFIINFEKPEFRIRFTRDRSTVQILVGTHQAEQGWSWEGWFDLIHIVMYLSQEQIYIREYMETFNSDIQLERLAKVLLFFYDEIVELYKPENYIRQKEALSRVSNETVLLSSSPELKVEKKKLKEQTKLFWQSLGISMKQNDWIEDY